MTRYIYLLASFWLASVSTAFAHAGEHKQTGLSEMLRHIAASPFHMAGILALVVAIVASALLFQRRAGR